MSSNSRRAALPAVLAAALFASAGAAGAADAEPVALRVCADPANLPYSDSRREGFENRIAAVLAKDLGAKLSYYWYGEHRSFLRRTLLDGQCDLIVSVPAGLEMVAETRPYFASAYVAVTRAKGGRHFDSFDDPWLKDARIGLQLAGREGMTTPVAVALSRRGINQHLIPFEMWGKAGDPKPQSRIVDAVADGTIDIALVWGPFAGYFAKAHGSMLRLDPIAGDAQAPDLVFTFPMAIAVRKDDIALRDRLQAALDRHADDIAAILSDYRIPTLPSAAPAPLLSQ
jgi:quinoprotein dehydrogenase-associated probable ABC transporter substrate-binding protein